MNFFREDGWFNSALLVLGALGTVSAILSWLFRDMTVILAFVAGGGWLISITLLMMLAEKRRENADLRKKAAALEEARDGNLAEFTRQLSEWRAVATNNSETLNVFASVAFGTPRAIRRKAVTPVIKMEPTNEQE